MKYIIPSLMLCFMLIACHKSQISLRNEAELIGQYEWIYSFGEDNNSASQETISDRYGIVFKKNGKVKFFTNGEESSTGYVVEVNPLSDGNKEVMIIWGEKDLFLTFKGNEIEQKNFPIDDHINIYRKL